MRLMPLKRFRSSSVQLTVSIPFSRMIVGSPEPLHLIGNLCPLISTLVSRRFGNGVGVGARVFVEVGLGVGVSVGVRVAISVGIGVLSGIEVSVGLGPTVARGAKDVAAI